MAEPEPEPEQDNTNTEAVFAGFDADADRLLTCERYLRRFCVASRLRCGLRSGGC